VCQVFLCYTYAVVFAATIVALALSFQPFQSPKEKGTSEGGSAQNAATTEHTNKLHEPPHPASAMITSQPPAQPSNTSTGQDANDVNIQGHMEIFTVVLAVVGVLQLVVMFLTWLVYRRQAGIMDQQRETMRSQWTTMEGQLAQMEASGRQTDQLIQHAEKNAEAVKAGAAAARDNAQAALLNAQALINAERPWIVIDPIHSAGRRTYTFFVYNFGRTPAEIIATYTKTAVVDDENEVPILVRESLKGHLVHRELLIPLQEHMPKNTPTNIYSLYVDSVLERQDDEGKRAILGSLKMVMVYGIVVYADVLSGKEHFSRFCYWWNPSGEGCLIRSGPDGANQHT
jgi:hypothetical protein